MRCGLGVHRGIDGQDSQSLDWASDWSSSDTGQLRGIKRCSVGGSSSNFFLPMPAEATHQHRKKKHRDLIQFEYKAHPRKVEGVMGW